MATIDQFGYFCYMHKGQPDFTSRLLRNYGSDLLGQKPKTPLIWLEANACSGDSISTLNSVDPELGQILCSIVEVRYWNALMPDEGDKARELLFRTAEEGGFILVVEGAISTKSGGKYAIPFKENDYVFTSEELIRYLAPKAKYLLAVGTCASFGGPSAAHPNPSGSKGVWEIIQNRPVINISGCPINPDWLIGTLFHLLLYGLSEVDRYQRPTLFYGQTVHSHCQRRSYFDQGSFAVKLGDPECMYLLGCMGPVTGSDCPYRLWNNHLNWPVKASTPCIGCTKSGFPDRSTPFYAPFPTKLTRHLDRRSSDGPENIHQPGNQD